jgi:outer membrane protein with beta-barrel domain
MKKIKITIAALCSFLLFSLAANAQKGSLKLGLNYNYSLPVSGFNTDLVGNGSPRGFAGELMYGFTDKLQGGLSFGFQDYYQKYPRSLYPLGKTQDVSAVISNSIQTSPVILKAKYAPLNTSAVNPYISLGAGVNIVDFKQYLGQFASSETNAGFVAQGGLGVMIPFGKMKTSGINVAANYNYAPYKKYSYSDLNSVNFQAGVYFAIK